MNYPYIPKRVGATVIDYTIIFLFMFFYMDVFGVNDGTGSYTVNGLPALGPPAFWFAYFILTERYMGGTLGHQLHKLKVVSRDGRDLSLGQVTKRRLCDALEIVWCSGLIAWLLVRSTDNHQRLGDLVAKTMVIGRDDTLIAGNFDFPITAPPSGTNYTTISASRMTKSCMPSIASLRTRSNFTTDQLKTSIDKLRKKKYGKYVWIFQHFFQSGPKRKYG